MAIEKHSTVEAELLQVVYQLLLDLKNYKALPAVALAANLTHDLGIGSLERVELLSRLESHFKLFLLDKDVFNAVLVADLLPLLGIPRSKTSVVGSIKIANRSKSTVNIWTDIKQPVKFTLKLLYSVYFYALAAIIAVVTWLAAWLVPGKSKVFPYLVHYGARIFLFLVGCRLSVQGQQNINTRGPALLIANHASYLDTIILCASLRQEIVFVAKAELLKNFMFRPFFNKQRHVAVERCNFLAALRSVDAIKKNIELGYKVVIYPEATFVYTEGLRLFKLGAFKIAAETNTPLYPIAIKGARKLMDAHYWVKPTNIVVSLLPPIFPEAKNLAEVVRLRDLARELIANESGEPILDLAAGGFLDEDS